MSRSTSTIPSPARTWSKPTEPCAAEPGPTRAKLAYAAHLRDTGSTIAEIVTKTGITRTSLCRHLPPRPEPQLTAAVAEPDAQQ